MRRLGDEAEFDVKWVPFQLNDQAPGGQGVNKLEMYKAKFGEERVAQMLPMMRETGRQEGINFSYGGNTGNTYDSHRLISFAAKQGKQDETVEELFRNYFEEEKCLSDRSVLIAAAQKVGLQGAEAMLASREEARDVDEDLRKYQFGMRISGVPHFIIDGKSGGSGAFEADEMEKMFRQCLRSKGN